MAEIIADLPVGIEPTLVADQPVTVEHAVDEFMKALWEAVAIVLAVSLVSLGLRAGAVVALVDPARAGRRVRGHGASSGSTCSGSRWAPSSSPSACWSTTP